MSSAKRPKLVRLRADVLGGPNAMDHYIASRRTLLANSRLDLDVLDPWVTRLTDPTREAVRGALLAHESAAREGAPESVLRVGEAMLKSIRREKLDGPRAVRKAEAAETASIVRT